MEHFSFGTKHDYSVNSNFSTKICCQLHVYISFLPKYFIVLINFYSTYFLCKYYEGENWQIQAVCVLNFFPKTKYWGTKQSPHVAAACVFLPKKSIEFFRQHYLSVSVYSFYFVGDISEFLLVCLQLTVQITPNMHVIFPIKCVTPMSCCEKYGYWKHVNFFFLLIQIPTLMIFCIALK